MKQHRTRHKVPHTAAQMYALVADVEEYPKFVPLCERLKVKQRLEKDGKDVLIADMSVAYKMFAERFATRVTLDEPACKIVVEYLDGPFRNLENRWKFTDLTEGGSEVDFFIEYEFRSRVMQMAAGAVFDKAFGRFSEAFERRADAVYGNGYVRSA